jgi:DNA-binding transcriptional LysR family regulator
MRNSPRAMKISDRHDDLAELLAARPCLPGYEPPPLPVHLLFAPDRRPAPKLRSFIDFVMATFGEA